MKFRHLVVGKDYTVALKKMTTLLKCGSLFLVEGDVCCFDRASFSWKTAVEGDFQIIELQCPVDCYAK